MVGGGGWTRLYALRDVQVSPVCCGWLKWGMGGPELLEEERLLREEAARKFAEEMEGLAQQPLAALPAHLRQVVETHVASALQVPASSFLPSLPSGFVFC